VVGTTEEGEAGAIGFRFSAFSRFFNSSFDTLIIVRIASVNRANSGVSGGVRMSLS
jgi:hypothetical protein